MSGQTVRQKILAFMRREPVLLISALAALISCCFVPPDKAYLGYFDLRTLALLYCLMTVVAGLRAAGLFQVLAHALCRRAKSVRAVGVLLVLLSFFSAMLITNDVALLTFLPFAVTVLTFAQKRQALIRIAVLQTMAANLGSMLTPVGNPQNLYLYSHYGLDVGTFVQTTLPVWAVSLGLILLLCLSLDRAPLAASDGAHAVPDGKKIALYGALFAVCLLVVVRVLPWWAMLLITVAALFACDRKTLLKADFCLLLTFLAFFVFSGNLARIEAVDALLKNLLNGREFLVSVLTSQIISNVPAALLLSGFTDNALALLLGVNVGGLGTPIASLASLIGLKLYAATDGAKSGRFLTQFLLVNAALLVLLSGFCLLVY